MDFNTYVNAMDIERRLENGKRAIQEEHPENDYRRAAMMSGFETAVDCVTCYRDQGGDIWYALDDDAPEETPILISVIRPDDTVAVMVGRYSGDEFLAYDKDEPMPGTFVYAWAHLPEPPDPRDLYPGYEEVDDHDGADQQGPADEEAD